MTDRTVRTSLFVVLAAFCLPAGAQDMPAIESCGSLENNYGPFDYTNAQLRAEKLPRVEKAHFDAGVQNLEGHARKTFTWGSLSADIAYTLRAFPNHHDALYTMAEYHIRGYHQKQPMGHSAECWFERAHRLAPTDGVVWLIEGIFYAKKGEFAKAELAYSRALLLMPNSSEAHYNLGLLYVEAENYSAALEHAKQAYELGYPMPGLRAKLERLGKWE